MALYILFSLFYFPFLSLTLSYSILFSLFPLPLSLSCAQLFQGGGLTEEEELDQEMDEEDALTEEEIATKATEAYWEGRASDIIAAADNRTNDGCLSVREIEDYLLRGEAQKDDKWFCHWFLIDNM